VNPWQLAQQIKSTLQSAVWPTGSGHPVFGAYDDSIVIFSGTPSSEQMPGGFPFCMIAFGDANNDQNDPDYLTQTFDLYIGAECAGDPLGEFSIIGGAATDGSAVELGGSYGRGVGEVTERVIAEVGNLNGFDGAKILVTATRSGVPSPLDDSHLVVDRVTIEAKCIAGLHYAAPQLLRVSGSTWTWEGSHCLSRFDFTQFRFGFIIGGTPASSPSGLDLVQYTGPLETFTHLPVAGRVYQIFADYSSRDPGNTVEGTSSALVGSYVLS